CRIPLSLPPPPPLWQRGPGCPEGGEADFARRPAAAAPVVAASDALVIGEIDGQNGVRKRGWERAHAYRRWTLLPISMRGLSDRQRVRVSSTFPAGNHPWHPSSSL